MPLINCEVSLTLTWPENSLLADIITQTARNADPDADPPVEARERIDAPTNATFKRLFEVVVWRIKKYYGKKKQKNISDEENQKYKGYFEGEKGVFIIEKLTRDVIERCNLPEAIKLRKKLGYDHDDIMVRKETSIAEKTFSWWKYCIKQKF